MQISLELYSSYTVTVNIHGFNSVHVAVDFSLFFTAYVVHSLMSFLLYRASLQRDYKLQIGWPTFCCSPNSATRWAFTFWYFLKEHWGRICYVNGIYVHHALVSLNFLFFYAEMGCCFLQWRHEIWGLYHKRLGKATWSPKVWFPVTQKRRFHDRFTDSYDKRIHSWLPAKVRMDHACWSLLITFFWITVAFPFSTTTP
jgi:hypothetical protein